MDDQTINDTLEKYYKLITKKRAGIEELNELCKKRYGVLFKQIVLMNFDELESFANDVIGADIELHAKEFSCISTFGNYIVNNLYGNMSQPARKTIFESAGIKTCPYCNRNYISFVVDRGYNPPHFSSTFELDHYYSKKDYPMLAVSFYNLIPVCPACNRIKGKKELILDRMINSDTEMIMIFLMIFSEATFLSMKTWLKLLLNRTSTAVLNKFFILKNYTITIGIYYGKSL